MTRTVIKTFMKKKTASYMLRRPLPWWKPEETIDEVVSFCRRNHVEEVMWSDETGCSYHELLQIPEVKVRAKLLQMAADRLRKSGVKHSIQPQTSLGHRDCRGDCASKGWKQDKDKFELEIKGLVPTLGIVEVTLEF